MNPARFLEIALANRTNVVLLDRLASLRLEQCHLTAGCLFQPVWNSRSSQPSEWGIRDYDVFYFDPDLSWEAEDAVIRQVAALTADLGISVETRNQARVHLWYERRFGSRYPALATAREGIDRYLIACTCVGIEAATGRLYAPHGLDDLAGGMLRINPVHPRPDLFRRKAEDYRTRWPWLSIKDPDDTCRTAKPAH